MICNWISLAISNTSSNVKPAEETEDINDNSAIVYRFIDLINLSVNAQRPGDDGSNNKPDQ